MLGKGKKERCTITQELAFQTLKDVLLHVHIFKWYDTHRSIKLPIDASSITMWYTPITMRVWMASTSYFVSKNYDKKIKIFTQGNKRINHYVGNKILESFFGI